MKRRWKWLIAAAFVLFAGPAVVSLLLDAAQPSVSGSTEDPVDVRVCVEDVSAAMFDQTVNLASDLQGRTELVRQVIRLEDVGAFGFGWKASADNSEREEFVEQLRALPHVASVKLDSATCDG